MDVELVVRRVFVYALTTLGIALLIGGVVYTAGLYAFGSDQSFSSGQITCASDCRTGNGGYCDGGGAGEELSAGTSRSTFLRRAI